MEKALRNMLPYYLLALLLATACGAFVGYFDHSGWKIGDWLVNYSGGFVRRGLFGDFVLFLTRMTAISPGLLVAVFQVLFYALYFWFSYLLLKRTALLPYALLIFSPFVFSFQLNDFLGGYRKEILYFALFSFLAYAKMAFGRKRFQMVFAITMLCFPLVVLSHEMFAVFLPYLLALYFHDRDRRRADYLFVFLLSLPTLITLLFSIYNGVTVEQENAIFNSWSNLGYHVDGGAIAWLHESADDGMRKVRGYLDYYVSYIAVLGLSLIAFMPIYSRLRFMLKDRLVLILLLCSILGNIVIALVALDWGRLIYINLVSMFVLSLASADNEPIALQPNGLVLIAAVIWALFFHIPHCCGGNVVARSVTQVNLANYFKPVYLLATEAPSFPGRRPDR